MGLNDQFGSSSTDSDKTQDDLSVSYIYIYEGGPRHSKAKPEHSPDAYDLVSDGGLLRTALKNSGQFGDIHGFFSQVAAALEPAFREDDYSEVFEALMVGPDEIAQHLLDNDEVRAEVISQLKAARDSEEESEEAPADD